MNISRQFIPGAMVVVAFIALEPGVWAADKDIPFETGDLANEENWGDVGIPTSSDTVRLTKKNGYYWVSKNINLGGIKTWGNGYLTTNVIDQMEYPDVTVTLPSGIRIYRNIDNLFIHGGIWDLAGTGGLGPRAGQTVGTDCTMVLDGVTANNVNDLMCAFYTQNTRFIITNSTITTKSANLYESNCEDCFYGQYDSTVTLVGESTGQRLLLSNKDGGTSTALFSGASTVFTNSYPLKSSYSYLFYENNTHENQFIVERGAKVYLDNTAYFASGANAHSNRLAVTGANSLLTLSKMTTVSTNPDGVDNAIDVLDGGRLVVTSQIDLHAGMNVTVSNGTLKTGTLNVGKNAESKDVRIRVCGANADLDLANYYLFNAGQNHLWEFDGSSCLKPDVVPYWACGQGQSSNVVRLVNGANVSFKQLGVPRQDACSSPAYGNELFVGNDSTMEIVTYLYAESVNSRIVVSNGTLTVNKAQDKGSHFILGNQSGATNCTLVLQGTTPKVKSGYTLVFWNHSALQLDLPEKDLRLTEPLIEVQKVQANLEPMYLKVTGWEKYQEGLSESANIPVISATSTFDAHTLAAIDEANANLVAEGANRVYFYTSSDKTKLYLHVHHPPRGMTIILR